MNTIEDPQVIPLGTTAFMLSLGNAISPKLTRRIAHLVESIKKRNINGIVDLVPSYTSIVISIDPEATDIEDVSSFTRSLWSPLDDGSSQQELEGRRVEIPIVYGGEAGPDLPQVSQATGLSPDEVIRRHSEAEYMVAAIGFTPGYAFLLGLPPELAVPRRNTPRVRVPAGSLGIGGAQTGIYSLPTPGGWSLIGRTPWVLFDPRGDSDTELQTGDRVRFKPVESADFSRLAALGNQSSNAPDFRRDLEIVEPGVQATIQDLGRLGEGHLGIAPNGGLDRSALIAGNRLLDNPDGSAAIEWTLLPPKISFHIHTRLVVTGADPDWRLNDTSITIGEITDIKPGDNLQAQVRGNLTGARGYICIAGGIDVPMVHGSRSLDAVAGFGGGFGRPLQRGDSIPVGTPQQRVGSSGSVRFGSAQSPSIDPFRILRGPQADRFDADAWSAFLSESFTVDTQSNRMGARLVGPVIAPRESANIISEPIVTGAIQITGGGQPIVMLPGRATIGGYPKIATVIEADHDRLGQLAPGTAVRFKEISANEARSAFLAMQPNVCGGLDDGGTGPDLVNASTSFDEWTPDGILQLLRHIVEGDVQSFSMTTETITLNIIRSSAGKSLSPGIQLVDDPDSSFQGPASEPDLAQDRTSTVIKAPLIGTFYRRRTPEEPPLVEIGDEITPDTVVGIIEVMKSFYDVVATDNGVVTKLLVGDAESVEYGQPVIEFRPK